MCLPKKFLNFGCPKIALPFCGNVPETRNEYRVKERLMMLVDLFSFKFWIWSLLLLFFFCGIEWYTVKHSKSLYYISLTVRKVQQNKWRFWRWLGSCQQRQSFVFVATLYMYLDYYSTFLQSTLDNTCQFDCAIERRSHYVMLPW